MKKKMVSLLLVSAMVASLAACGGSKDGGEKPADNGGSGAASGVLTVNIWDNNQREGLQKIADEWSQTSGVSVRIEVVDWDNYWTLLEAGAGGGQLPDVFWMHSNTVQEYMAYDILLNLTDYVKNDNVDMSVYYEGIKNLYTREDGNIYALPKDHDTIALLYNKSIFDKYEVECPTDDWTWEDMYEASKAIFEKSNGEVYGMAMNTSNNQDGWYNLVYSYGGNIVNDDHKGSQIGSDASKAGMEMMRKLLTTAPAQSVVAETGTDSLFKSGKCAMITQGSWMINSFYTAENGKDYFWAMLPYADVNGNGTCEKEERWSAYNGLGWAAAANTSNPDAAWSLIKFFCSEEGQKKQAEYGVTMGGMTGVSDAFASAFEGLDISAFMKIEEEGSLYFRPYTKNTVAWEDKLQQAGAFLDAWQDPSDPAKMAAACDNAQKIIETCIAAE